MPVLTQKFLHADHTNSQNWITGYKYFKEIWYQPSYIMAFKKYKSTTVKECPFSNLTKNFFIIFNISLAKKY